MEDSKYLDFASETSASDFLLAEEAPPRGQTFKNRWTHHVFAVHCINVLLAVLLAGCLWSHSWKSQEPFLNLYSPANDAVEYHIQNFSAHFHTKSNYMGFPTEELNQRWNDLHSYINNGISASEARKLVVPTLPQPDSDKYLIQLEVFHQLHCLDDIRKAFYPDYFVDKWIMKDGKVDYTSSQFLHWEHCIDMIRQAIMCHSDVTPLSWRLDVPPFAELVPRLATTHVCRNFTKIQEWAEERHPENLRRKLRPDEVERYIELPAGVDTWEDVSEVTPDYTPWKVYQATQHV